MPGTDPTSGKILVLVVDDEPLIRMNAADIAGEAGFTAIEVGNADEAIRTFETRPDIRFLITDIDMPAGSMNGLRLAATVRDRWPPIKIIVVSGHYRATLAELPPGSAFLSKPYCPEDLVAQLRELDT